MDKKPFKDLTEEEIELWQLDYHQSTAHVRGSVLNAATALEMSIDLYITNYFTTDIDKSEELMKLIISPRMTFENKVQALIVLLERHNRKFLEENKSTIKDLLNIIIERNILPHYPLDTTPHGFQAYYETGNLTFFKFKNVKESAVKGEKKETTLTNSIVYDVSKIEAILNLINKYHLAITLAIPTAPPPTI